MTLNANGGIATVTIRNPVKNMRPTTQINVRTFSVLVKSDSTVSINGRVYEYNKASGHIVDLAHSHMMFPNGGNMLIGMQKDITQFTTVDEVVNEPPNLQV